MHSGRFKNNDALFFQFSNLHWVNTNNARFSHSRLTPFFHFLASFFCFVPCSRASPVSTRQGGEGRAQVMWHCTSGFEIIFALLIESG